MSALLEKLEASLRIYRAAGTRLGRLRYLRGKYLFLLFLKKILRTKKPFQVRTTLFSGASFKTLTVNENIWLFGVNPDDAGMIRFLIRHLKPGSVFLDAGAHHGFYAVLASELVGAAGSVHAFEPAELHFSLLSANAAKRKNIFARRLAVSDTNGELEFYEHDKESSTFDPYLPGHDTDTVARRFRRTRVGSVTLDSYCAEQKIVPALVKIDVEGAEFAVISGASDIWARESPIVIMEVWKKPLDNKNHLQAIAELKRLGYDAFVMNEDGSLSPRVNIEPERDIREGDLVANFVWMKPHA